jgi:NAD-dependent histone deacetylase SIR2
MTRAMDAEKIPRCKKCKGLVKPNIVFFGESLPPRFRENVPLIRDADLVIVMGTSLTVSPFAQLPQLARGFAPRLLINLERVGDLGSRKNDVLYLGKCDDGVREFAKACGWLKELEARWAKTKQWEAELMPESVEPTRDQILQDEVDKLTSQVEKTLKLAGELTKPAAGPDPAKGSRAPKEKAINNSKQKPSKAAPPVDGKPNSSEPTASKPTTDK